MKLNDLENGAIVQDRRGDIYISISDKFYALDGSYIRHNSWYNDDLKSKAREMKYSDIMKVNNNTSDTYRIGDSQNVTSALLGALSNKWEWERKEEILDKQEKAYLEEVIKPFKNRTVAIIKSFMKPFSREFIRIIMADDIYHVERIDLPFFEKRTMYRGMEIDKEYSIKDLGLFKEEK